MRYYRTIIGISVFGTITPLTIRRGIDEGVLLLFMTPSIHLLKTEPLNYIILLGGICLNLAMNGIFPLCPQL